ncbi:hypothetical protein OG21DRAFT_1366154, partial [Imleria badia]
KMYGCQLCNKMFSGPNAFALHMNITHPSAKSYKCTVVDCNKSFVDQRNLRRHLRTHEITP